MTSKGIMESIKAAEALGETQQKIPEEIPPISDDTQLKKIVPWIEFTEKTTFHGVRYIFEKSALTFRRYIWLLVVVTAILVFVIQVGIRTGNYFEYGTTTAIGMFYTDSLEFPAITICNQNRHRTTAVVKHGLYDVVDEVFKRKNISDIPWKKFGDRVNGIGYGEFTLQTGHQKLTFLDSCTWNGIACDIDKDFNAVLTDLGLCYTFNGKENVDTVITHEAGAGSGLKLVINIEQYEYMRGPQQDAGIKILLHPREETPVMQEQGFAAAPGTHTLVAMKRSKVTTLPPPYGICHPNNLPVSQCRTQCQARDIIKRCGCQTEYMQPILKNGITCDFKTSLSCVRQMMAEKNKSALICDCKPTCQQVHYELQLSYAQLSKFNIDRMILDNLKKQKLLQESYLKARETTQRYRDEVREKDSAAMSRLMTMADEVSYILRNISKEVTDPRATSHYHNLPAIIVLQPLQMDFKRIKKILSDKGLIIHIHTKQTLELKAILSYMQPLDFGLSNTGTLTYDLPVCYARSMRCSLKHYLKKISSYNDRLDIPWYEASYHKNIISLFDKSTKSPDAIDSHKECLGVLGLGKDIKEAVSQVNTYTQDLFKAQTLQYRRFLLNKLNAIRKQGLLRAASVNLTSCSWAGNTFSEVYSRLNMIDATAEASLNNARLMNAFDDMSLTMAFTALDFEVLVKPISEIIAAYMNGSRTKIELYRHMHSPVKTWIVGRLSGFESDVYKVIRSLQNKLTKFKNSVKPIYVQVAESTLPLLNVEQVKNLEFIRLAYGTNRTDFQDLIDGISENMTNVQVLIDLVFSEYDKRFQEFLEALIGPFKQICYHMALLRDELLVYAESSSLNVNFFMQNFLQLDIFYKDMSYEVVTQQQAFGVLSLLGEVGGFMGLLLGASVITVFELLDYLLLNVASNCSRRRKEDPNVDKRKLPGAGQPLQGHAE